MISAGLDQLVSEESLKAAAIVGLMPRGGLQVLWARGLSETDVSTYDRVARFSDDLVLGAIRAGQPMSLSDLPGNANSVVALYAGFGATDALAMPIDAPVFAGYPAALLCLSKSPIDAKALTGRAKPILEETKFQAIKSDPSLWAGPMVQFFEPQELDELSNDLSLLELQRVARSALKRGAGATRGPMMTVGASNRFRLGAHADLVVKDKEIMQIWVSVTPTVGQWLQLTPAHFPAAAEAARMLPTLSYMAEHFAKGPSLNEIARVVHISPFHFHRRFTDVMGPTPKHFLFLCQLEHAFGLLQDERLDLVEISKACGFAHQSHFTSRFKQATGQTPARWRSQRRREVSEAAFNSHNLTRSTDDARIISA